MATSELKKIDLSTDEVRRINDALKDEEFRKMFVEYAEEISNPDNRRQYEEEIFQMEKERGMNVQFILPDPGYVLKTTMSDNKKAFINISKNDKIGTPTSERGKGGNSNKTGFMWHIPHSFAPPRDDFDKAKNMCQVFDFVIHPSTYRMALKNLKFRALVESTAIEGIEKNFDVTIDKKNIKRPKLQFKGTPCAAVIRTPSSDDPPSRTISNENDILKKLAYPYSNVSTDKKINKCDTKKSLEQTEIDGMVPEFNTKAIIPKYTIVHRSNMDIQDYCHSNETKLSTKPHEIVIKIELPLLDSAVQANLEIFDKRLLLKSMNPATYELDLVLPYHVKLSEGKAQFDKQKRCLAVVLPVDLQLELKSLVTQSSEVLGNESALFLPSMSVIDDLSSHIVYAEPSIIEDDSKKAMLPENINVCSDVSYTLPEFSFAQDMITVSFVIKVKNVLVDTISKSYLSCNIFHIIFSRQGDATSQPFFSLYLKFSNRCHIICDECSVDVAPDNVVLILMKAHESIGIWDYFWSGVDANTTKVLLCH